MTDNGQLDHNIINHIGVVLDASGSMHAHRNTVVKVIDNLVKHLATQSQQMNQETRISVWTFGSRTRERCIVWDMDVLRLPSIDTFYHPGGMTALIDGTMLAINDLKEIPTKYGNHSFLLYVPTDGEENDSCRFRPNELAQTIREVPENWTIAALVPDSAGIHTAKRFGFPAGNIDKWDATTRQGIEEFGERLTQTSTHYMTSRASGVRGTKSLFSIGDAVLNKATVQAAPLVPLDPSTFILTNVGHEECIIKDFITDKMGKPWVVGRGYYELTKAETIQPQKGIIIVERATAKAYSGKAARQLLGLGDEEVRVSRPGKNSTYDVFIQSTSWNRKLKPGQKFIYFNG